MQVEEITTIKTPLLTNNNSIKLFALADAHIGDACADISKLRKVIDFIKNTPNMYVVLLGDILNTGLKNSKSDVYSETMSVRDAQKLALELLTPIKDRIIGITPGNHENRVWREVGVDISLWLAEKLGLQDVYRNNGLALNIMFGKDSNGNPYHLHVFGQHGGYGGGRKLGSAINAIEDMDGIICNADLYIRAHTHSAIQGKRKVFHFNDRGEVESQTKNYFNAVSFLNYGGYAYDKGYRPQSNDPCYLNINAYCYRKGSKLKKEFKIDTIMM